MVAWRWSAVSMAARITRGVCLRFNNPADNPAASHVADDRLPNKISGQLRRFDWQVGS